jgi:hypothetical protein
MDFDLTEDQSLLADSVRKMFADGYGFEQRKAYIKSAEGWSTAMWAQYAELGLLGLPFAEEDGGFGGGLTDTCLIAEQMGKAKDFLALVQSGVIDIAYVAPGFVSAGAFGLLLLFPAAAAALLTFIEAHDRVISTSRALRIASEIVPQSRAALERLAQDTQLLAVILGLAPAAAKGQQRSATC